jgi:hypothetical protein
MSPAVEKHGDGLVGGEPRVSSSVESQPIIIYNTKV